MSHKFYRVDTVEERSRSLPHWEDGYYYKSRVEAFREAKLTYAEDEDVINVRVCEVLVVNPNKSDIQTWLNNDGMIHYIVSEKELKIFGMKPEFEYVYKE